MTSTGTGKVFGPLHIGVFRDPKGLDAVFGLQGDVEGEHLAALLMFAHANAAGILAYVESLEQRLGIADQLTDPATGRGI